MGVYYGTTEITNVDWIPGDKDVTQAFFGSIEVFTVWGEYDGTLPAQYSANGDYLAGYRIYGSAMGVGDDSGTAYGYEVDMSIKSGNLFNPSMDFNYTSLAIKNEWRYINGITKRIPCEPNQKYSIYLSDDIPITVWRLAVTASDNAPTYNAQLVVATTIMQSMPTDKKQEFITPSDAKYILFQSNGELNEQLNAALRIEKIVTVPIYIGSSPLGEDEYVDYGEGKIYRKTNIFEKQSQDIQLGKAIDREGNIVDDPTAAVSGLIDISEYSDLYVEGVSSGNTVVRYIIYTGATSYVWRVIGDESVNIETNGADHMRITVLQSCLDTAVISPYSTPQPQDPPVPLPALPTVDGTNIVDYVGQSTPPSRFVAKYRKEGF